MLNSKELGFQISVNEIMINIIMVWYSKYISFVWLSYSVLHTGCKTLKKYKKNCKFNKVKSLKLICLKRQWINCLKIYKPVVRCAAHGEPSVIMMGQSDLSLDEVHNLGWWWNFPCLKNKISYYITCILCVLQILYTIKSH